MSEKLAIEIQHWTLRAEVALQQAVAEVMADHKRTGDPIVVWRDGKVVWVSAEEIEVPKLYGVGLRNGPPAPSLAPPG